MPERCILFQLGHPQKNEAVQVKNQRRHSAKEEMVQRQKNENAVLLRNVFLLLPVGFLQVLQVSGARESFFL